MSELGAAEIPVVQMDEKPPLPAVKGPVKNPLLDGPILSTLLKLAAPNVVALTAGTCVAIAETSYIGGLGVDPLAARSARGVPAADAAHRIQKGKLSTGARAHHHSYCC